LKEGAKQCGYDKQQEILTSRERRERAEGEREREDNTQRRVAFKGIRKKK